MSLADFINTYNGKIVDTDGYYGGQCMDLMHRYIMDVLGLDASVLAAPTAYQAFLNGDSRFQKVLNTPTGVPQAGDIIFWNTTIGSAGHVAIFLKGDANNFTSLDQNWPTGSTTHEQAHNYNGVAGWLHPIAQAGGGGSTDDINRAIERIKWTQANHDTLKLTGAQTDNYDDTVHNLVDTLDARNKDTDSLRTQVANLQTSLDASNSHNADLQMQITDLNQKVGDLTDANTKLTTNVQEVSKQNSDQLIEISNAKAEVAATKAQLAQQPKADSTAIDRAVNEAMVAEAKSNTLQGQLNTLYSKLGVDSQDNALSTIDTLKKPLVEQIKPVIKQHEKLFTQLANLSKQLAKTKIKPSVIEKVMLFVKGFVSKIIRKGGK